MIKFPMRKTGAVAILTLALAACGGGDDGSSGASTTTSSTPYTAAYQVGENPTDTALSAQQALLPPSGAAAATAACKLSANYFAEPEALPGGGTGPLIPKLSPTATTNVDEALAAGGWSGGDPIVPSATSTTALPSNGLTVPAGYPTAPDTNRIQAALYACANQSNAYNPTNVIPSNGVVELAAGAASGQTAFVTGPLSMPGGVTLVIDKGVTLYASRDPVLYESGTDDQTPANYGGNGDLYTTPNYPSTPAGAVGAGATQNGQAVTAAYYCGQISPNDDGCNPLISNIVYSGKANSLTKVYTSNNAVMGPGVIDGQGGQPLYSLLAGKTSQYGASFPALITRPTQDQAYDAALDPGSADAMSWWDLGWEGNEALAGQDQNNPRLIEPYYGNNFTIYNVTLQSAPKIHVSPVAINGVTVWGMKIFTPTQAYTQMTNYWGANYDYATVKNTDGFDPGNKSSSSTQTPSAPAFTDTNKYYVGTFSGDVSNVLLAYSYISDSDDDVAIKGESGNPGTIGAEGAVYNLTFAHDHFFYGHGMSIGSQTAGGPAVGNPSAALLATGPTALSYTTGTTSWSSANQSYATQTLYPSVSNINVYDLALDYTDNGIRIKTNWTEGGLVSNINYTNVCMQGNPTPSTYDSSPQTAIYIYPYYTASTNGGLFPSYQNINVNGLHELSAANWTFQGFNTANSAFQASGWSGAPGSTTTKVNGQSMSGPIVNPLGLTLNNVQADQPPVSTVMATDANITVANVSASLTSGLTSAAATAANNVTVSTVQSIAQPQVGCSSAFSNLPNNTDVNNGQTLNSPFPGQQFPEQGLSNQQVPAQN